MSKTVAELLASMPITEFIERYGTLKMDTYSFGQDSKDGSYNEGVISVMEEVKHEFRGLIREYNEDKQYKYLSVRYDGTVYLHARKPKLNSNNCWKSTGVTLYLGTYSKVATVLENDINTLLVPLQQGEYL